MEARVSKVLLLACVVLLTGAAAATSEGTGVSDNTENAISPCKPGEVFKECVSSDCAELTCARQEPTDECSRDCDYGCFCKDGLYRNAEKDCVSLGECPRP